jgi:signal transduction histidine kinase
MVTPGVLLLWRIGTHPVAVAMTGLGWLWILGGAASAFANLSISHAYTEPAVLAAYAFFTRIGPFVIVSVPAVLTMFPDGFAKSARIRALTALSLASALILPTVLSAVPAQTAARVLGDPQHEVLVGFDAQIPSLQLPDTVWLTLLMIGYVCVPVSYLASILVMILRSRSGDDILRAQLRWLIWSAVVVLLAVAVWLFLPTLPPDPVMILGVACMSTSVLFAVSRYRLYDIDRLISGTLIYGTLFITILLVDGFIMLAVNSALPGGSAAALAAIVVFAAYLPLQDRAHRLVLRWTTGRRDDPYGVLSGLVSDMDESGSLQDELSAIAHSVRRAFATPYAKVELRLPDGATAVVESGRPTATLTDYPLTFRGTLIGNLSLSPSRGPRLTPRDQRLLGDLIRQAAAAVYASISAAELQQIREAMVLAREDERHRIHRDLHDGLGPTMAGLVLRMESAKNFVASDSARATATLEQALTETRTAMQELRRLVHGLRPPSLDEVGLVRALSRQCELLGVSNSDSGVQIHLHASPLPRLSAAVEVAAYRIVSEALNNVVRHSGARRCDVRIHLDPVRNRLNLQIDDDGVGLPAQLTLGVGLRSQRERAEELGGTWRAEAAHPHGLSIHVSLPLHPAHHPAPLPIETD